MDVKLHAFPLATADKKKKEAISVAKVRRVWFTNHSLCLCMG